MSVQPDILAQDGPWSEEAYLALPDDWRRVELLDGALLVSPNPSRRHQRLSLRLAMVLDRARPAHLEVLEGINVRLASGRILIPDLAVVRMSDEDTRVFDPHDVLLAAEIVSPGSIATDRAVKPPLYAQAGIPTYIRIEREGPTAHVLHLQGGRYVAASTGTTLRLVDPFGVEVDLALLISADWSG